MPALPAVANESMPEAGQTVIAKELHIAALNPAVAGENTAGAMQSALSGWLRPVPVSPGLLVYLEQVKRARVIELWRETLGLTN